MGRPGIVEREARPLDDEELIARVFRALGDRTRLRILQLLLQGELSQREIVRAVGATQSRVSEHLACLAWCGFVRAERSGREVRYCVASEGIGEILSWARDFLETNEAGIAACRRIG